MSNQKLQARDFITIGLFSILMYGVYLVVITPLSPFMLIAMPYVPAVALFFMSIVYLLMALRIGKRGVLLLSAISMGIIYTLLGVPLMLPFYALAGCIGELILWRGDGSQYRNVKRQSLAFSIYASFYSMAGFFTVYILGVKQFEEMQYPTSMIDQILHFAYSPFYVLTGMLVTFISAYLGCLMSTRLLHKHFVKAGYIHFN